MPAVYPCEPVYQAVNCYDVSAEVHIGVYATPFCAMKTDVKIEEEELTRSLLS